MSYVDWLKLRERVRELEEQVAALEARLERSAALAFPVPEVPVKRTVGRPRKT